MLQGILNRRHLRAKAFHAVYANIQTEGIDLHSSEKDLKNQLEKVYKLYTYLLSFFGELHGVVEQRIESGLQKKMPTPSDLVPNTKFRENKILQALKNNTKLQSLIELHKINWERDEPGMVRRVFKRFIESVKFDEYMGSADTSLEADQKILEYFFKEFVVNDEEIQDYLEELDVFWMEDLDLVSIHVLKTICRVTEDEEQMDLLLPLYKRRDGEELYEDRDFILQLFRKAVNSYEDNLLLIEKHAANWDIDRIALADRLIMSMAISEAVSFPEIPLKATLNEYIEMAKLYSTPKSAPFINGILDKIFADLLKEGKIKKIGRGLLQ